MKKRLGRANRRAKSVPLWVVLKTNRKLRRSHRMRSWHRSPKIHAR
ncbi:MAG: 50S ribosomal protein L39e [Candidatus Korarchaeota archaeon]